MATGATTNYFLPYPLSTDPVRVAGDIEQLATKIDNDLQEIIEDRSSSMWTGGTFNNGLSAPTYNDTTGKMSMSLAQDLRTTASPTFTGVNLVGGDLYLGPSRSIIFEGSSDDAFETTFTVTNPTADRTITFQNASGTVPFSSDVHFIGTTSIALNRASAAQSLTGITSIDGSAATLTTGRTIGMTGDVTWTSASFNGSANVTGTSTISNSAVTYAKIQNVSAQFRVLGRITTAAGVVEELTPDNMVTLINQASTAIAASEGGTGQTSYTIGDILYASSSSALTKLAGVATGNALISGGVGAAPSWGKVGLTTHITGTLEVANGGTGVTTSTGTGSNVLSASPTFTGTPLSTTAATNTNTTQIATTAFVVGQASSTNPLMNGTVSVGTSLRYSREDHVHPTDTTRAPLASPTFTGTVTVPAPINNTDATTKLYVDTAVAAVSGALPSQTGNNGRYLTTNGTAASWDLLTFSDISTTPTTLAGYGITDAINTSSTTQTKSGNLNVVSPTAAGSTGVRQVTMSTASPSGGADGDMWLVYV